MDLNSAKFILLFTLMYSGVCLYLSNSLIHDASVKGGRIPVTGFHSVIDKPESVKRVSPPIKIIQIIALHITLNHRVR